MINLNITEKDYKNYFGFSYLHYSNILEEKCIPNGKVAYHYTTKTFSTTSHLQGMFRFENKNEITSKFERELFCFKKFKKFDEIKKVLKLLFN